jgi:hypothetical protein
MGRQVQYPLGDWRDMSVGSEAILIQNGVVVELYSPRSSTTLQPSAAPTLWYTSAFFPLPFALSNDRGNIPPVEFPVYDINDEIWRRQIQ